MSLKHRQTSRLALVIILLAAAPWTTAHLTNPEGSTISAAYTPGSGLDNCRWEGYRSTCIGSDGVSGNYDNNPENFFHTGGDVYPLTLTGTGTLFPNGYAASVFAWCDLEVQGSGQSGDQLFDESRVDDQPTPGLLEDGTWDDGGFGGACHGEDAYQIPGYNTPGCGTPTHAIAEDTLTAGSVWIAAGCDGVTRLDSASFELCLYNEAVTGPQTSGLLDCINAYIGSDPGDPNVVCGADGIMDSANYGPGAGSQSSYGTPLPTTGCSGGGSGVYPLDYVSLGGQPCHNWKLPACSIDFIPATTGWIDSRDLTDHGTTFGPGLVI